LSTGIFNALAAVAEELGTSADAHGTLLHAQVAVVEGWA
jgi:hypothetical protein